MHFQNWRLNVGEDKDKWVKITDQTVGCAVILNNSKINNLGGFRTTVKKRFASLASRFKTISVLTLLNLISYLWKVR